MNTGRLTCFLSRVPSCTGAQISSSMGVGAGTVRWLAALTWALSYHYFVIRQARMYEIRAIKSSHNRSAATSGGRHLRIAAPGRSKSADDINGQEDEDGEDIGSAESGLDHSSKRHDETVLESKSNMPRWDGIFRLYYRFSYLWHAVSLTKHLLGCLLDSGALDEQRYGYLDCLLIGRVLLNPRVTTLLKYAAVCVLSFHLMYESFLLRVKPSFKIHCMEFLLMSPGGIEGAQSLSRDKYNALLSFRRCPEQLCNRRVKRGLTRANHGATDAPHLARPNRSPLAWYKLSKVFTTYMGGALAHYLLALPLIWLSVWPMVVTRPGFEISYRVCLEWLASRDDSSIWRRVIYDAPRNHSLDPQVRQRFFLPFFGPPVELNGYHTLRIAWDLAENLIFQFQFYTAVVVYLMPSLLIVADVYFYSREIARECECIIRDARRSPRHHGGAPGNGDTSAPASLSLTGAPRAASFFASTSGCCRCWCCCSNSDAGHESLDSVRVLQRDLSPRVARVQELVVDLFSLVRDYNLWTDFYVCFIIFIWGIYSLICSSWLFMPARGGTRQESRTPESQAIQASATGLIVVAIGAYSMARASCVRLYKRLLGLATLQGVNFSNRQRWPAILQHYHPLPLYCCTIRRTTELSWLFALKITAWLFSLLFVLSTFSENLR